MLITVLLPGIIKMTLQQRQPVVTAVSAVSVSPPSSCHSSHPPSGILATLIPSMFLPQLVWRAWRLFNYYTHISRGLVKVSWGCWEQQIWGMRGSDVLPPYSCSEHHGTQLPSAGYLLRQGVQVTSPFFGLHLMKQLVFPHLLPFRASWKHLMKGLQPVLMIVEKLEHQLCKYMVCCNKFIKFIHNSLLSLWSVLCSVMQVSGDRKPVTDF